MRKGFIGLGAKPMDIIVYEDTDFNALVGLFRELTLRVSQNWDRGRETTLVFVYYAGHGVMDNTTFAVLNDPNAKKWKFPLEKFLRTLGTIPGAWVVGLFDCCRERLSNDLRGGGIGDEDNDSVDD